MLVLNEVTRRFGDVVAVDRVSLGIPKGQMVGVIGRSGAGKSTLLRLVNRLLEPFSGNIRYDTTDVGGLRGRALIEWRARCAMIFQQFNLVNRLDVITNVLIGRLSFHGTLPMLFNRFTAPERALAVRALDRFDMADWALQRAETLSGGQQQRVAIARALVQEPAIVLADEPIASLDPKSAAQVMDALRAINREDGITVICNLHAVDVARDYCDRIVGMAHGRVVFDAAAAQLTEARARDIYGIEADADALDNLAAFRHRRAVAG
jgi:phosphonate transport system ATP-binding protein